MSRRLLIALLLLLPLMGCGRSEAPTDSVATAASAAAAATPSIAPAEDQTASTVASAGTAPVAAPATVAAATDAGTPADTATPTTTDANAPRLGIDYEILPTPQPPYAEGKIEVAEVFSYACIHCAEFQPTVDAWLPKLPKDVRYEYVPAVFQKAWENFARAYFAAKVLGIQERTHDAVFKAVHIEHAVKSPSLEDIADWYGTQGVDRNKFLDTMNSFGVNAMVNRAKQFALRTGIEATPTIIVAGKYKVNINADRGFDGMLATVDYLLARERAMSAATPAPTATTK